MVPTVMKPGALPASEQEKPTKSPRRESGERPIRVLFLNTRDWCGADVAVHLSLIRAFDRERTRPYLLSNSQAADHAAMERTCREIGDLSYRFAPLGVPADQLHGKAAKIAAMGPVVKSLAGALALIRREKIDIIHATDRPRDAVFSTILGKLAGKPNVIHMHSNCGDHLSRETLWGFRNASAVLGVSEYTRQGLIEHGVARQKAFVAHNATDADYFNPEPFREIAIGTRREWNIPPAAPVIGIVGRLIPWKGQRELIEAVAKLRGDLPELRLVIVGEGEDRHALTKYAEEKGVGAQVIFAGWHDDVRPILASLDLFALPSYEEPFGLAITEAMAMELPVIACASGGVPEIITHGENGWLIPPRSSDAVAGAIKHLVANPGLCKSLAENARRTVADRFSPRAQAGRVADIYARLLVHRRPEAPIVAFRAAERPLTKTEK